MGVCLCKDKVENGNSNDFEPYTINPESQHGNGTRCAGNSRLGTNELSDRVDDLVRETLDVIASIVDDEPEPPNSMLQLHDITDRPKGWLCLVRSLIRVVRDVTL